MVWLLNFFFGKWKVFIFHQLNVVLLYLYRQAIRLCLLKCNFNPTVNQRFQGKCLAIYLFLKCPQQDNHKAAVPQPFWHQGSVLWKTVFPQTGVGRCFQMIQTHGSYYLFYFYYYYINSSSVHQELDPTGWGICHK